MWLFIYRDLHCKFKVRAFFLFFFIAYLGKTWVRGRYLQIDDNPHFGSGLEKILMLFFAH